jgi:hypothetical protein
MKISAHYRSGMKMFKTLIAVLVPFFTVLAITGGLAVAAEGRYRDVLEERGLFSCLSQKEAELVRLINEYRTSNGLPPVANSRSLNKVARIHAIDLRGTDSRGMECNLHSWSKRGFWSPVCYTSDHFYMHFMWVKPQEITDNVYDDVGYENVYWISGDNIFPTRVLERWRTSPEHNALILETGKWAQSHWRALGVGIYRDVAIIWVGSMDDPLGPLRACRGTSPKPDKMSGH